MFQHGGLHMKRFRHFASISCFVLFAVGIMIAATPAKAAKYVAPTGKAVEVALKGLQALNKKTKGLNKWIGKLEIKDFAEKDGYLIYPEAGSSAAKDKRVTVVIYQRADGESIHAAVFSEKWVFGEMFSSLGSNDLSKASVLNPTLILVTSLDGFGAKADSLDVSNLPKPVRESLLKAESEIGEINVPPGIYMLGRFGEGKDATVKKVFKEAGLGKNPTFSMTVDGSDFSALKGGKIGLTLNVHLDRKNGIARLIDLTQVMKSPKDAAPVISISTEGTKKIGVAYKAPYIILGQAPIDTELSFAVKRSGAGAKLSGSLSVTLKAKVSDPVIIPDLIEFKKLSIEDPTVEVGFEQGEDGLELSAGMEFAKFKVGQMRYNPAKLVITFQNGAPSGGLFHMKGKGLIDLKAMARHDELVLWANPSTAIMTGDGHRLNKGAPRLDLWKEMKLDKLPPMGIKNPEIYLATPGNADDSHLQGYVDEDSVAGKLLSSGFKVSGTLQVMGRSLGSTTIGFSAVDGITNEMKIKGFTAGKVQFGDMETSFSASVGALPHYRGRSDLKIDGVQVTKADIEFGKNGFTFKRSDGCFPPMLKYEMSSTSRSSWDTTFAIDSSDCAKSAGKAAEAAAKAAGKAVEDTAKKSGESARKTYKKAVDLTSTSMKEGRKIYKKVECWVDPGSCKKKGKSAKDKRKKALDRAAKYRMIWSPAHCRPDQYWNPQTQNCFNPGYDLLYYAADGNNGRCLTEWKNKVVLWQCQSSPNQHFKVTSLGGGTSNPGQVSIETLIRGGKGNVGPTRCLSGSKAGVSLKNCNGKERAQKWRFLGGRLMSLDNLCLYRSEGNKNGAPLKLMDCGETKKEKVEWVKVAAAPDSVKQFYTKNQFPFYSLMMFKDKVAGRDMCFLSGLLLPSATAKWAECNPKRFDMGYSIAYSGEGPYVFVQNANSRMCMDIEDGKTNTGTPIRFNPCRYDSWAPMWEIVGDSKKTFKLKNRKSGLCLTSIHPKHPNDRKYAKPEWGGVPILLECSGQYDAAQLQKLKPANLKWW